MKQIVTVLLFTLITGSALAQGILIDDFESGTNTGGWNFDSYSDVIETAGGNPGSYLHNAQFWAAIPVCKTAVDAPEWTGDLAAAGACRISGDFQTLYCENDPGFNFFPVTVIFMDNNGTPSDPTDDTYVYADPSQYLAPPIGGGWTHYEWDLPFDFTGGPGELPAGWRGGSFMTGANAMPADKTFQDVVSNVREIWIQFQDPEYGAIFAEFNMGADNIMLEFCGSVPTKQVHFGDLKSMYR